MLEEGREENVEAGVVFAMILRGRRPALFLGLAVLSAIAISAWEALGGSHGAPETGGLRDPRESHLANIRHLTFGGQNAEAYFSADGTRLILQATRDGFRCDQIFTMDLNGNDVRLVSTGKGRTTCGFFFPDQPRFIYASTHLGDPECPPRPDMSRGYVWPIYPAYDIFSADLDGSRLVRLTDTRGYDAEGAISPDGKRIVFTSIRDGDLELYTMDADGKDVKRLTHEMGYDGGAFYSYDGKSIVYRAYHPRTETELEEYEELLAKHLVRPSRMELYLMDANGGNKRQITDNGAANFAPFLHPNGRQIIFASNLHDPMRRTFALYLINIDGTGLERVTYGERFASFPMFSPDGKKLVFVSTRNARAPREMNVFIADWVP